MPSHMVCAPRIGDWTLKPLYKFVGGKRWLCAPDHAHVFPDWSTVRAYREPFFGGGAVFYGIVAELPVEQRPDAVISDMNPFVVDLLNAIRDTPASLAGELLARPYDEKMFYACRDRLRDGTFGNGKRNRHNTVELAADFLAVVRYGFNGLWRVNSRGLCNVPFGRPAERPDGSAGSSPSMPTLEVLRAYQAAMAKTSAIHCDFETALANVRRGDWVYLDPPFEGTFTGYGEWTSAGGNGTLLDVVESNSDLARLARCCEAIDRAGAKFLLSESDTPVVRQTFKRWQIDGVQVQRSVSCDGASRGKAGEVLVRNYA